jgi:hypothetical protein
MNETTPKKKLVMAMVAGALIATAGIASSNERPQYIPLDKGPNGAVGVTPGISSGNHGPRLDSMGVTLERDSRHLTVTIPSSGNGGAVSAGSKGLTGTVTTTPQGPHFQIDLRKNF